MYQPSNEVYSNPPPPLKIFGNESFTNSLPPWLKEFLHGPDFSTKATPCRIPVVLFTAQLQRGKGKRGRNIEERQNLFSISEIKDFCMI